MAVEIKDGKKIQVTPVSAENLKNIHIEDASEAFEHLADVWGLEAVISDLAERNWNQSVEVAEKMVDTDYFRTDRTEKDKINLIEHTKNKTG